MRRLAWWLLFGACSGGGDGDDGADTDVPAPLCPVGEIPVSGPAMADTALDSADLDTGLAFDMYGRIEACVQGTVALEGSLHITLQRRRVGDVVCDMLYPLSSTTPTELCPDCTFAFEVEVPRPELRFMRKVLGQPGCVFTFGVLRHRIPWTRLGATADAWLHDEPGDWMVFPSESFGSVDAGDGWRRLSSLHDVPTTAEAVGPEEEGDTDP